MPMTVPQLMRRLQDLQGYQWNFRIQWQDIADYIVPHKSNITRDMAEGTKQTQKLYDGTALHASQLLASTLHATLTPSTQPWLSLSLRDEELNERGEVKGWLEDCARRMYLALRQSNFNQAAHEMYSDLVNFATGCLFVDERPLEKSGAFGGLIFTAHQAGEYYVAEDIEGRVDTLFRVFKLTARTIVTKNGWTVPDAFRERAVTKPDEKHDVLHAVFPRDERNPRARGGRNMPWASVYVLVKERARLDEGGFEEFPFMVPRWSKTPGEFYGRGPSHWALPDVKTLNATKEFILMAAPLAMMPPSLEREDGVIGDMDRTPGGRNVVSTDFMNQRLDDIIAFLDTKTRPDLQQLIVKDLQASIRETYFVAELMLRDSPNMTATEIIARQEQMQRILGPTSGRLESEFLNLLTQRIFGLMSRARAFLPPPQVLREAMRRGEVDLDVEYEGPLARAQRSIELTAQNRVLTLTQAITQAKNAAPGPEWDNLETDHMIREAADITGLSAKSIRSQEDMDKLRAARAEAQQKEQQKQDILNSAEALGKVAPAMGQAAALQGQNGAQAPPVAA